MENDIESAIPEDEKPIQPQLKPQPQPQFKPVAAKKPPIEKPIRPAKPILEGINSVKSAQDVILVKPNLSQKEKELINQPADFVEQPLNKQEPRLMPESVSRSVNKKNHHIGRWLLIFVVLLILIAGGYEYYCWNLQKAITPVLGHYHPASDAAILQQPFALAGGSLSTTTSSTMASIIASSTPSGTATTTQSSTTPSAALTQLKITSTPTGYLNVRSSPSTSGTILTQVHPGDVYSYTAVQNGWYEITYSGLSQGWVSGQYITKQ